MKTSQTTTSLLLFAALIPAASGCCSRLFPNKLFVSQDKAEEVASDNLQTSFPGEEIETILQIGGRARRIASSPDSKRVLLERKTSLDDETTSSSDAEDDLNVELWNVEFSTGEQEEFREDERVLTSQKSNCASFSAQGNRLFWLDREQVDDESQNASDVDGTSSFLSGITAPSFELRNVVLTKELGGLSLKRQDGSGGEQNPQESHVKRLKTDDDIKKASRVRISPEARWLIYRSLKNASSAPSQSMQAAVPKTQKVDFLYDVPSWFLVAVADRKRVVHFPDVIKMTFDSSTSDEIIEGRVVDVLDVSDKGDLVATLVEELPKEKQPQESPVNATTTQTQNWNPRYKIVIWDLEVVRTVDLEKKRSSLYAIEVSQIPIRFPIDSRDCHFSTDGKVLAAKVEPRSISVWQTANGRLKGEFWEDEGYVRDFALASNGMRLVAGIGDKEGELLLWDIRTCVLKKNVRFPQTRSIDAVTFANSDERVLFVDSNGAVKSWKVDVGSYDVAK